MWFVIGPDYVHLNEQSMDPVDLTFSGASDQATLLTVENMASYVHLGAQKVFCMALECFYVTYLPLACTATVLAERNGIKYMYQYTSDQLLIDHFEREIWHIVWPTKKRQYIVTV